MSWYTNLLPYDLERRLKHSSDRATTELTSVQNECTLAGQSAVSRDTRLCIGTSWSQIFFGGIYDSVKSTRHLRLVCVLEPTL